MTISLSFLDGHEFYKDEKCISMWFDYVNEIFDNYKDKDCEDFLNSNKAFLVNDDKETIGFGIYHNEENKTENIRAMILLEFYTKPEFRSIKRFLETSKVIKKLLSGRHFNRWYCGVATSQKRKINAYTYLGFVPFKEIKEFTIMEMEI